MSFDKDMLALNVVAKLNQEIERLTAELAECKAIADASDRVREELLRKEPVSNSYDMVDRIADCLVEDHIDLMRENERLQSDLTQSAEREAVLLGKVERLEREQDELEFKIMQQIQFRGEALRELTEAQQLAAAQEIQLDAFQKAASKAMSDVQQEFRRWLGPQFNSLSPKRGDYEVAFTAGYLAGQSSAEKRVEDAQEELRLCQQDAIALRAQIATYQAVIQMAIEALPLHYGLTRDEYEKRKAVVAALKEALK